MESETRVRDPSGKLTNPIDALRRFAGVDAVGVDDETAELVFLRGDVELFRADALLLATKDGDDLAPCVPEETYGVALPVDALPAALRVPAPWSTGLVAMLKHAFASGWAHDTRVVEAGLEHLVVHGPLGALDAASLRVPAYARTAYVLDTTFTLLRALFMLAGGMPSVAAIERVARAVRVLSELAADEDRLELSALVSRLAGWAERADEGEEARIELTVEGLEEAVRWRERLAAHDARHHEIEGIDGPDVPGASLLDDEPDADGEPMPTLAEQRDGAQASSSATTVLILVALVVAISVALWFGVRR